MPMEAKAEERERCWQIWPFKDNDDDSSAPLQALNDNTRPAENTTSCAPPPPPRLLPPEVSVTASYSDVIISDSSCTLLDYDLIECLDLAGRRLEDTPDLLVVSGGHSPICRGAAFCQVSDQKRTRVAINGLERR